MPDPVFHMEQGGEGKSVGLKRKQPFLSIEFYAISAIFMMPAFFLNTYAFVLDFAFDFGFFFFKHTLSFLTNAQIFGL